MIAALIPSRGLMHSRTMQDIVKNKPDYYLFAHGFDVPEAHNHLVKQAFATDATHFFFVDDDMKLPDGILQELLDADADIALADYPVKAGMTVTVVNDEFLFGGLGCVLVKRDVMALLGTFRTDTLYNFPSMKPYPNPDTSQHGGHDVDFFVRAKYLGFTIKVIDTKAGQYYSKLIHVKGNNTSFEVEELCVK